MFLATTGLEETWPQDGEIRLLGSFCLRHGQTPSSGRIGFLSDPWTALEDRRNAYRECMGAHEALLPALADELNAAHGIRLSLRAWRILLSPWLIRYAQSVKDRHERLRRALDVDPRIETSVLAPFQRRPPSDTHDFVLRVFEDRYNFQLASRILDAMGVRGREIVLAGPETAEAPSGARAPRRRAGLRRLAAGVMALAARFRRWPLMLHGLPMSGKDAGVLLGSLAFDACLLDTSIEGGWESILPDWRKRAALLRDVPSRGEYERVLARSIPGELPSIFLEGFPRLLELASRVLPKAPRVLVSADGWTYDELFKACAARSADQGSRLVAVQHGGGYGHYGRIWQEDVERSVSDAYWAWGWSRLDGDPRLRDVPAPSLALGGARAEGGQGLVLVGAHQPRWRYGFQSQALAEQFGEHLSARESFLSALPVDMRRACAVRLSAHDLGWGQAARLRARAPEVALEHADGPLWRRLERASLAVFDQPGTAFLEALAFGRPTLLFWNPEVWDERASARPLLDALRRARVLHDDPESAAGEAAAAWRDPFAWWDRSEAQAAVAAFREHFCLSQPRWRGAWARALRAELAAAEAGG